MESALRGTNAAFYDQRTLNSRFREKHLASLFDVLQSRGEDLLSALQDDGCPASHRNRHEKELEAALSLIKTTQARVPNPGEWWKTQTSLQFATTTQYPTPVGTIVIRYSRSHPFLSIVAPLTQAIFDSNAAVLVTGNESGFWRLLTSNLRRRLDQGAYTYLVSAEEADDWVVKVHAADSSAYAGSLKVPRACGPNPIILDQSLLDGNPLPHPLDDPQYAVPASIYNAISWIARHASLGSKEHTAGWTSSAQPSYLIVHENIISLVLRAISETTSLNTHRVDIKLFKSLLEATPSLASLDYLPILSVTSADLAIDLLNSAFSSSAVTYIFANARFASYIAKQTNAKDVCVNCIPDETIVQGQYRHASAFSFTQIQTTTAGSKLPGKAPSSQRRKPAWKAIRATLVKQRDGFRVDFFFSGILLSFGTAAGLTLGATGYGGYKLLVFAYKQLSQRYT